MRHKHAIGCFILSLFTAVAMAESQGLPATLQAVLTHHPAIKGKQAERQAQTYAIDSAKAQRYPSLSAEVSNLADDLNRGLIRVQQPLWTFGKIDTAIEQAQVGFEAERWGVLQVQRQLIEEAAVAYAQILGAQQRLQVAADNIGAHERLYARIERRQKGHLSSKADARLAFARLVQARAQKQRIQGEWRVALNELQALTQIHTSAEQAIEPNLLHLPALQTVEDLALSQSADIGFKRESIRVVRLAVKQEKVAPLPTLFLRAEHDFLDTVNTDDETRIGLAIEANLEGLGLVARGRVQGAAARLQAAQHDLSVTLNDVRRRVRTLMLERQVQQTLAVSQQEAVLALEETMASFLRQYDSGRKSWIEVLNTQRELTELRFQWGQINNDEQILSLRVAALIGQLDQLAGIKAW